MPRPISPSSPRNAKAVDPGRTRLLSSFVMLILVVGVVWFYSIRETGRLFDIGVNAHVQCAVIEAPGARIGRSPLAEALGPQLAAAGAGPESPIAFVSGRSCLAADRDYIQIVLRQEKTLITVALTQRRPQEIFPRTLVGRTRNVSGIQFHESERAGYAVSVFEPGPYLAYVVSGLSDQRNADLAARLAPIILQQAK